MKISIREAKTNTLYEAEIRLLKRSEMPLRKDGWQFNWRAINREADAVLVEFYGLFLKKEPDKLQGLVLIILDDEGMLTMKNIEVAPHNFGYEGKYKDVAGCLIAFACKLSFEKASGNYIGFLSFDSKTELIDLYMERYGATQAFGHKMYFSSEAGQALVSKYLIRK